MNELQLYTGGAVEDGIKIYTGRADRGARSAREFPSGDPYFQRTDGGRRGSRGSDSFRNRKTVCRENALVYVAEKVRWAVERLNISDEAKFYLTLAAKYLVILAVFAGYTATVYGISASRADKAARTEEAQRYAAEFQAYVQQQEAAAEAARLAAANAEKDEAEMIARVFYGVEGVETADLRTLAWCIFNRVDNPRFGDTVQEVITEEGQFEMYRADYPVIEELYQIATEELDRWQNGKRRPVSNDYVYMKWSYLGIELRDNFKETGTTRTWRFK